MNAPVRLAVCLAAAAVVVSAQQGQTPTSTFRTEANYVRVDVYPTVNDEPVADLTQNDFEVLEDGAPQKVEQFEHVVIRGATPQEQRREPNTVAESRQAAADPRARLFVLFLDIYHVEWEASVKAQKPLVDALNQLIGPDDLIGVMTPEMRGSDVTFARRTTTIEGILTRYARWGERNRSLDEKTDPQDQEYAACFPNSPLPDCQRDNGIATEMIDRRHEKATFDALSDLVQYLRGVREERKAILAITNGWLRYRPNAMLGRQLVCGRQTPAITPLGVDPRNGRVTTKETQPGVAPASACEIDRQRLANLDLDDEFRRLMDEANRANASFYPIDPRGLAVFDTPIMRTDTLGPPPPPVPVNVDQAMLRSRINSLRDAAVLTDGLAVVDTNNLAGGMRRITNDLSAYYLLGYYSSGKLDGKFHSITVRVKRQGVRVRARRGYLAARTGAVANSVVGNIAPAAGAPPGAAAAVATAAASAVGALAASTRDQPLRLHVVAGWKPGPDGKPAAAFWTVGEVTDRIPGTDLDAAVMTADGMVVGNVSGRIAPGATSTMLTLVPDRTIEAGTYRIRLRSRTPSGTETLTTDVTLPQASGSSGPVYMRRGPNTGNKDAPTADLRFRRSERVRVEFPSSANQPTARLLDRTGRALPVPVTASTREDGDGARWTTAELALNPLAPGDYVIEMAGGTETRMVAFRVIP